MADTMRLLLSGDEAVAQGALDSGVALGCGYPGTPSTEILEHFSAIGGKAEWAPNEKVALEVALGASFGGARTLVTMKHVGVNVAADPLFTAAYTGVTGAMVIIAADDPGMASSQNEQDSRHYARAAGLAMLEPADSQEAYEFTRRAIAISEQWKTPVLLRLTTRVCHSKTIVQRREADPDVPVPNYVRDVQGRVMIPAYARPAHRRLRLKLAKLKEWNEESDLNEIFDGDTHLGIITSGVSFAHVREAAPEALTLKVGMSYPLPLDKIRDFVDLVDRCVVIEEGDPYLLESIRAAGMQVEGKTDMYRFGELNVARVRRIIDKDTSPEPAIPKGKPPQLCVGCPHRTVFESLRDEGCIVAGDIGCYTLGVLPPFEAIDTCVCMGASIGVGLGLRHVLPEEQARKVVSVIGDSTFVHSGITGLVEMVYNRPRTGHVVIIVDNGTTAMTGLQEHPGTGRTLSHEQTHALNFEALARSMGIENVYVIDPTPNKDKFISLVKFCLGNGELNLIISRRPCLLLARKLHQHEQEPQAKCEETQGRSRSQ